MQICRNILPDLESQANSHAEKEVSTEILHRIFASKRLIRNLHGNNPPCASFFGTISKNRVENIRIQPPQLRIACQVNDIVGHFRNAFILMKHGHRRQEVFRLDMSALRSFDFCRMIPHIHNKQNQSRDNHRKPAAGNELRHRRDEEQHMQDSKEQPEKHSRYPAFSHKPEICDQQNHSANHGNAQRQTVGFGNLCGSLENQQNNACRNAQNEVNRRNIKLSASARRISNLQMRPPVQTGRLGNHGK